MTNLRLEVDIDKVKESVISDAEKQIKEYLLRIANEKVHSDYELGIFIRDHIKQWIKDNLKFDQLIYEFGENGWVHCSYDSTLRQEVISAKKIGGKTKYLPGLVK